MNLDIMLNIKDATLFYNKTTAIAHILPSRFISVDYNVFKKENIIFKRKQKRTYHFTNETVARFTT
jgi:hypothetical protein